MDYAEWPLPNELEGWVAAVWMAAVPEDGPAWCEHDAVPDGCVELIYRHTGRSVWRREQPRCFATGLATTPARLRLGAGSRFTGVKLWPWAWQALAFKPCRQFFDDWIEVPRSHPLDSLAGGPPEEVVSRLSTQLSSLSLPLVAESVLKETTVAAIARSAGLSLRQLQRYFAREIGVPPRSYLRLLRFGATLREMHGEPTLAETAATGGYADQAHLARDFRSFASRSPSAIKARARGPFV
jgi:AraC-like DNA-binding protein